MNSYAILLRGINVGGKNKLPMAELKQHLEGLGFEDVITYIQSGNVVLRSNLSAKMTSDQIETTLPKRFKLDGSIVKVLALDHQTMKSVVTHAPNEFGSDNDNFRYYIMFLIDITPSEAMKHVEFRQGVDEVWQGEHVIYYRLPSLTNPNATKSRLSKLTQTPIYQSITIRNWNTTVKLSELLKKHQS